MKGLSLKQPWASLVAIGAKGIETRDWSTKYRGPVAIHASAKFANADFVAAVEDFTFREALREGGYTRVGQLPLGAIVATAFLARIERIPMPENVFRRAAKPHELAFGNYQPGRYGWILTDVRRLANPVVCRGALGLWEVPPEVLALVNVQLENAA